MTPDEFTEARKRLGLTQRMLAKRLGMGIHGWQSISAWENGRNPIPRTAVVTLGLLARDIETGSALA